MDIDLARTFLEIVRTGSFIAAAERLHVTQTAVTARIHNLEGQLGCRVFVRNRGGAQLTPDGEQFVNYANILIQTWETARKNIPLPDGAIEHLNIGGEISLWNPVLLSWTSLVSDEFPDASINVEVTERQALNEKLERGLIDLAIVHQPEYWPGMQIEQLLEEKLILVKSAQNPNPYVFIDWGDHYKRQHDASLPQFAKATRRFNLGPLGLNFILENGGQGYFRTRVVERLLSDGALIHVTDYPEFSYPVYLVYLRSRLNPILKKSIELLYGMVRDSDWSSLSTIQAQS